MYTSTAFSYVTRLIRTSHGLSCNVPMPSKKGPSSSWPVIRTDTLFQGFRKSLDKVLMMTPQHSLSAYSIQHTYKPKNSIYSYIYNIFTFAQIISCLTINHRFKKGIPDVNFPYRLICNSCHFVFPP